MLRKNNFFFKKLSSFKKKTALILENNKLISYNELLLYSEKIVKKLKKEKKLVFLLGSNNLETIIGYISFINKGYAVVFLDFKICQYKGECPFPKGKSDSCATKLCFENKRYLDCIKS